MLKSILVFISLSFCQLLYFQAEKMKIEGVIVLVDSEATTALASTIKWDGQDFKGFDGTHSGDFLYTIEEAVSGTISDDFSGDGPLLDYTTNNESALPSVTRTNGRYRAELLDNTNNITLHFNGRQGRLDAKVVSFPFEYIVRNIGIGTLADSQTAPPPVNSLVFAGIQAHVYPDFNSINSSHFVVGHRGGTENTVEGKNTVNGSSSVNDAGVNVVPDGRADMRLVGQADNTILWYYQVPNFDIGNTADNWIAYRGTGLMPGTPPEYGDTIYLGPITYASGSNNVPFVGTIDAIELVGESDLVSNNSNLSTKDKALLFNLSPNPTTDEINIEFNDNRSGSLSIFSIKGNLLFNKDINAKTDDELNISYLAPGLYLLNFVDKHGNSQMKKFQKL